MSFFGGIKNMKYTKIAVLILFCSTLAFSLSIKDLDKFDRIDSLDYVSKAKEKANNEQFSQSYELLKKASSLGLSSSEYKDVEKYIEEKKKSYEARLERERLEKERKERARLEKEQQERLAAQRQADYDASGNKGGSINCNYVSSDYGLYQYCSRGSCDGLSDNYNLYQLCKYDDIDALSGNYTVYQYLKGNGNSYAFTSYNAQNGAQQNERSYADRKRFIIFYLRGYIFRNY